jgi:hypothetical protein
MAGLKGNRGMMASSPKHGFTTVGAALIAILAIAVPAQAQPVFTKALLPSDAPVGTFTNTTSDLSQGGIPVGEPASANIVFEAAPLGNATPVTNPIGTFVLVTLLAAAAIWRLRWRV